MKCEICEKGIPNGVNLFRQNEKGVAGVWRCTEHNKKYVHEDVKDIIEALKGNNDNSGTTN